MIKFMHGVSIGAVLACSVLGCTANVENPKLDQTGSSDSVAMCTTTCDGTETSCTAKCTDDGCKATCTTDHGHCISQCTPPADGG
jgi:hypothetical protein